MPGEKRLLIIGIDEYQGDLYRPLTNAKKDVNRFAKVLMEKYGYVMARDPLFDSEATNANIRDALIELSSSCIEEDNLVIYFAGHGIQNPISKKGAWIPYDGQDRQRLYIPNSTVLDDIEAIPARHILLISDSCFSGTFISRRRGPGKILSHDELDAKNSRWIFVSGEEASVSDGKAGEGSPFGMSLCEFLEKNTSPSVSASEMFNEVIRMVEHRCMQNPQADFFPCQAHDGGQLIFRLNNIGGEEDKVPYPNIPFPLPDPKIEYYIPRQLSLHDHQQKNDFWYLRSDVEKIYLNELVSSQKRIVVLGGAGSGKSIELLNLAHQFQNENNILNPIYKRFNTYTEENIDEYLPSGWRKSDPGNLLVLLDGLDEVQPQFFQTAIRKITGFSNENPLVRLVISCRNNFYEAPYENFSGTLEGFQVYNLTDISLPEIKEYADRKFDIDGQNFIEQVYNEGFLDLVQKPFFLNILIKHYIANGNFGSGRSGIMEEALFTYYANDKEHFKSTLPVLSRSQSLKYLEKIAFVLELLGKNFLTDEELEEVFPNTDELIQAKYLPAFNKGIDQNRWLFEHNNLQEYIASRVLSRKPLEDIINVISVVAGGKAKVKPSWVNTLSFFISISDDDIVLGILEWIIENDIEVIVKFEPDRINPDRRLLLFKQIIGFYNEKQIWIYSNNFSDKDLARFCETEAALDFLLENLESKKNSRISKLNFLSVLRYFNSSYFESFYERIKTVVLDLINLDDISNSDLYTIFGTLADLGITDHEVISNLVDRFSQRRNQYIRAGMYKILIKSDYVDEFIDVFIDGIDLVDLSSPASDRDKVNLMSESDYLKMGFQMISKPKSIKRLMDRLAASDNRREVFMYDYQDIMESLVHSSVSAYQEEPMIYHNILQLLLNESLHDSTKLTDSLIKFFNDTQTNWTAIREIWEDAKIEDYSKAAALLLLVNQSTAQLFFNVYGNSKEDIEKFYNLLSWQKYSNDSIPEILDFMEERASALGIVLQQPVMIDWKKIGQQRDQKSFDLLFDDELMLQEIKNIFAVVSNDAISRKDLSDLNRTKNIPIEERFANSATLILYRLTQNDTEIKFAAVKSWIEQNLGYSDFRINHIYSGITNRKTAQISERQIDFIRSWCKEKGNDKKILWDFINRFDIELSTDTLLEFTNRVSFNYDFKISEPGSIEELERFIPTKLIKERVVQNLTDPSIRTLEWTNNAGYALRKNMVSTYPVILEKLSSSDNTEYKFGDILGFWFSKVKNTASLKKIIVGTNSDNLKWKGINLLEKEALETAFLVKFLKGMINDQSETRENRIYAANHLMMHNDIYGLEYIATIIEKELDPGFDFRISLGNISLLNDIDALGTLMKLLLIGKQAIFKNDDFNDLEERALAGIYSVGAKSSENFLVVKNTLEAFIEDHENKLPNLNFLYYTILKIEESLKQKYSVTNSIQSAIAEYDLL